MAYSNLDIRTCLLFLAVFASSLFRIVDAHAAPEFIQVTAPAGAEDPHLSSFEVGKITPFSGRIAFSAAIAGKESIYVLDLDSGKLHPFIKSSGNDSYPVWSPRGTRLSFTSTRDGNKELYLSDWEGLALARLTKNSISDDNASWTADGSELVYYSDSGRDQKESNTNLFFYKLADGSSRRITSHKGRNTTPQISASGAFVAFSTNRFWPGWDVCLWNIASGTEECPLKGRLESYCRPAWSPSDTQIAYSSGVGDEVDISVMNISDRSSKTITSMPLHEYDAAWSPSGKQIIFAAENGKEEIFNLYIADLETKEITPAVKAPFSLRFPTWTGVTTLQLETQRVAEKRDAEELAALSPTALPEMTSKTPGGSATPLSTEATPAQQ